MQKFLRRNLSGSWLYEFNCQDDQLITDVLELVKQSEYRPNYTNASTKSSNFFQENLFDWFDSCINIAKDDLQIPKTINLPITICWANKTSKLQNHHLHSHANSFMSGIFYLTDGHDGGDTIFACKNPWFDLYNWLNWPNKQELIHINYKPKKGNLVLFPSHIKHRVDPVKDNHVRYTVAFNTFFAGPIDDKEEYKTELILYPKTVRELYK